MFKVTKVPVLNTLKLHFTTKNRINNVREHMWIINFRFKSDFLAFGSLGLNIVLPEMSFFFAASASTGRSTGCVQF